MTQRPPEDHSDVEAMGARWRERRAWRAWPLLLGIVIASVVARAGTYWRLGSYDARLFAYIGARWRDGAIPYRDIWDSKPPGIFLLMAFAGASRAPRTAGLVVAEGAFVAAAALLVLATLRRFGVERVWAGAAAACVVLLSALQVYSAGGGLTELFTVAPAVATIYCWARGDRDGASWFLLAGASAGLGALFKLPGISPFLAISVLTFIEAVARARPARTCIRSWALIVVGLVFPWGIAVGYFAWQGTAREFLYASLVHPFIYGATNLAGTGSLLQVATTVYKILIPMLPLLFVGIVGMAVGLARAPRRTGIATWLSSSHPISPRHVLLVGLWFAADLCGAFAGGRFSANYFTACMASACVAFGLGLHVLFQSAPSRTARRAMLVAICAPLVSAALNDLAGAYTFRNYVSDEDRAALRTAEYLRTHARREDTLFVWEWLPLIYQSSGMTNAFPLTSSLNLIDAEGFARERFADMTRRWQASEPSWVVLSSLRPDPRVSEYEHRVAEFVAAGYDRVHVEGPLTVYRLRRCAGDRHESQREHDELGDAAAARRRLAPRRAASTARRGGWGSTVAAMPATAAARNLGYPVAHQARN